jgi:hypothetical protein
MRLCGLVNHTHRPVIEVLALVARYAAAAGNTEKDVGTRRAALVFTVATLAAGVVIERSGEEPSSAKD